MAEPSKVVTTARKPPNAGKGRVKGVPNKITASLKEMILAAAERAGGKEGTVGYLTKQANENPQSFLPLLGKVLPMSIQGDPNNPIVHEIIIRGVRAAADPRSAST